MGAHHVWIEPFLEALAENPNVAEVCRGLGIARRTVYDRRQSDPDFASRMETALAFYPDLLEGSVMARALDGWEEPIFHRGVEVARVRKYDNSLSLRVLCRFKPEYRQNYAVELSGHLALGKMSDADLDREIRELQAKLGAVGTG